MKFGKQLRAIVDQSYEQWRSKFINYKDLKKCILPNPTSNDDVSRDSDSIDQDQQQYNQNININTPEILAKNIQAVQQAENNLPHFFSTFRHEVSKVNDFYLDKQEDYIIESGQLSSKVDEYSKPAYATRSEVNRLYQRLINLHGELVRLENFSTINYTGFRKILKKHDKKTGFNIQDIYLSTVLKTPFYLSDTVRKLIQNIESQLNKLENIRKFRKTIPATNVSNPVVTPNIYTPSSISPIQPITQKPSPASINLNPNTTNYQSISNNLPIIPTQSKNISFAPSPCTPMIITHPHSPTFVPPRSALSRLYEKACSYGNHLHNVLKEYSNNDVTSLPPPRDLVDTIDEIMPAELGLHDSFLKAIIQPSNYCATSEQNFSMGFIILPAKTNLQLFRTKKDSVFFIRNLCGKVRVKCYSTCTNESTSTYASEPIVTDSPDETVKLFVEETRKAITSGPWPCFTIKSGETHIELEPQTTCALFYVSTLSMLPDAFQRFDVCPLNLPRARVCSIEKSYLQLARFSC